MSSGSRAVVDLIAARKAEGSVPGARTDTARLALVVEGGSSRGAFSSGMTLVIEQFALLDCFDALYGSSAGALNGAWLLCGRAQRSISAWWDPRVMPKVINPRRALLGRPIVDTRLLVEHVYVNVFPMGFEDILAGRVSFHPLGTDARTGESTDLRPYLADVPSLQLALRASTCLPVLAGRPIALGPSRYVDAGVAETVPILTALKQGATHVVALRTRREDEMPGPPSPMERRFVGRYMAKHAPGALDVWMSRHERRQDEERALREHPAVLQIRPPAGAPEMGRVERGGEVLRQAVALGRAEAMAAFGPALTVGASADGTVVPGPRRPMI
ncbi:MAG: patatin-like phospholipase family protein [Actinocrinis sp.]